MSDLSNLLDSYRAAAASNREAGTYFEELTLCYLRNEATYRDLYSNVWTYSDWAKQQGIYKWDVGIDLVAKTAGTDEIHAIQCKLYPEDYRLQKLDIDSFFTASGKKPFSHRIIVSTTNHWSDPAEDALLDQQPPVSKIDLFDLENSQIDWAKYKPKAAPALKAKKVLRDHQKTALADVISGLSKADRGKLIMACGTGKTFTSLKIAEALAGSGKRVLFLVPSLALLSQSLTEWTQESDTPLHSFAVCSDSDVGKKRKRDDDTVQIFTHELRYPATTDPNRLAMEVMKRHDAQHMSVVFGTYHSIDVISQAQHRHGMANFDLIVCDEAHRTTGATFDGEAESSFVKVHDAHFIRVAKRLYMTATPRIYGDKAQATAEKEGAELYGMDDVRHYGEELHIITFSEAVKRSLLVDYKVIVLAVEEAHVSRRLQSLFKDENNQLKVDDAAKIVGCWKALSKQGLSESLLDDESPMQRAVAFCQVIEIQKGAKTHKVSSKSIASMFQAVVEAYQEGVEDEDAVQLACEAEHVDGSMNASEKETKLAWLKAEPEPGSCRILSNVRCLSEGVDVPALDAVLFLTPRNSQVDVVQSVGRVMRNAPGKKRGYVVLPVVIPAGVEPHEALNDNRTYKVVWQVLQALRSHDDRFDAMVNKLDLIGKDPRKMEVVAITDNIQKRQQGTAKKNSGKGSYTVGELAPKIPRKSDQGNLQFEIGEIERAIYAKLVQKVGNRNHWEDWANDIAKIARTHIGRITTLIENPANVKERAAFDSFTAELRDDLNDSIEDSDVIEMLAQHIITKPVFDALFKDYSFASQNPISQAMQGVLDALQEHHLEKEADALQGFYDSVKLRAEDIDSAAGKQKIVVELYNKFFNNAFPRMKARLGIVYTPVEVVDFIIHSVEHLLQNEFGQTLGSEGVHIIDPFTGTGTFITRLLQSGLIKPEELVYKYCNELHANEIVLLAYYIAAINIEAVYHGMVGGAYKPFEGICLTDTFQMYEKEDLLSKLMVDNSHRRKRQRSLDIQVIMANPPYSVGQESTNDDNQNIEYAALDGRISDTYVARSNATNKNSLYNSYIRAIRWATDRIGQSGIIGFVTPAGFLDGNVADGLRKCLVEDVSNIYVFHLRGNQRKLGDSSRREGGKIFGSGSRVPIAISLLVKNPDATRHGQIHFHDIGDYLNREEKLEKVKAFGSIAGITTCDGWKAITPDKHGDWLKQRDANFMAFTPLGARNGAVTLFKEYSAGVQTNRDAWCVNSSRTNLLANMTRTIAFYNDEVQRFGTLYKDEKRSVRDERVNAFISKDPTKISWTRGLKKALARGSAFPSSEDRMVPCLYRPFGKRWLYFDRHFNEYVNLISDMFPRASADNRAIVIKGNWSGTGFFALMTNSVTSDQSDGGAYCFPLYLHDDFQERATKGDVAFDKKLPKVKDRPQHSRRDGLSDDGLAYFQTSYPGERIGKEDLFHYVYGLLHSRDYLERFSDNLEKELPRIPRVKTAEDFWVFSHAGLKLAKLHLNFETVPMYAAKIEGEDSSLTDADYRVDKMRYGKKGKERDLTKVHYNNRITILGIPLEAYDYVVNGKPAIDWVIERQCVTTDKASGIVDDANDWAVQTTGNTRYSLELLLRIITVSIETMKIVAGLPDLLLGETDTQQEI